MSTFIGILLDVSGSMESSIGDGIDEDGGTWAQSIFTVIDDLVKHDVSESNRVFACGFGAVKGAQIFDTIGTIQQIQKQSYTDKRPASYSTIEDILCILQANGARTVRKWAEKNVITKALSEGEAKLILMKLSSDVKFIPKFVYECLPRECRDWNEADPLLSFVQSMVSSAISTFKQATVEDVKEVVEKSMALINESLEPIAFSELSVYSVKDAATVIHGCIDNRDLTKQRARELLAVVEPYIYGSTPLYSALNEASSLFLSTTYLYPDHHRLLFILSDGDATDTGDLERIQSRLQGADVTIVGCYISRSSEVEPRTLHNVAGRDWEEGARFLFKLSSTVPTELVTRAVFIKHGWQIDITNNETKLFMHVNHPDHLKEACDLARNIVSSQDALADTLSSVSLDLYINQKNTSIKAHEQVGGTCYANASAAVLHLAMHRILGRDDGYPDFEEIRDNLINNHGSEGANTFCVIREVCPVYRLRCKEVDVTGAMKAVTAKRPVVAKFRLTDEEWNIFGRFYRKNPKGIMKKEDLDITKRRRNDSTGGHAVVLTSFNSECLRLMNSWGENWADMGFFRVENSKVLGLEFIDVFWTVNDLSQREKDYYRIHGSEVADKLMRSLKGLQTAEFTCPRCMSKSKVTEFSGTLSHALCPNCNRTFSCDEGDGNILALNVYLTSLCR